MIATKVKGTVTAEKAVTIAQDFIADKLGNLIGVTQPYHITSGLQSAWGAPLVLTSPSYGIVGVVGVVMIDQEFGHIIGWTPLNEVNTNADKLANEKKAEIEAAFQSRRLQYAHAMP
ncbi:MAG: hypothetical protein DYG89_42880 [Caldilinea sp. CFX5]|nr:hypothetical protein [Caldilinea sp. CFX5]